MQLLAHYYIRMPSSANLRPSLSEHPFARHLHHGQIASLDAYAEECSIPRGDYIWHQGEPDEAIYLIFSGEVALEISVPQQGPLQIEMVGERDVLGWSCLLPPSPSYFDARAITPVQSVQKHQPGALSVDDSQKRQQSGPVSRILCSGSDE